jgi:hypothetical protein
MHTAIAVVAGVSLVGVALTLFRLRAISSRRPVTQLSTAQQ